MAARKKARKKSPAKKKPRRAGKRNWTVLKRLNTTSRGVFGLRATHRKGQEYRVRWTSSAGKGYTGPAIRAYKLGS